MKLKILAVIALGAVGVGAAVFAMGGVAASSASTTDYLTSAATTGDVTDDVAATGALAAQARYGLAFGADPYLVTETSTAPSSDTTWPVKDVKVAVGDAVAKGDVLATASTTALKRDLATAENSLASANVSLRAAKTTLSDAEDADVTAQIRQAKIGLYNAKNQVAQAKQDVADLKAQIKAATLVAPIAGVVTEVDVVAGFDAPAGVAIIVDAAGFQVTTDVVESDLADVKVGQAAKVAVSAVDADIDGTVSAISPVANADSGSGVVSYPVTVTLTEPPATLRSGMSADVTITVASATNVLTVPAAALRGTEGDYSVLLLGADGQPQAQPVEVGLVTNTSAEIKSGLTEGQAVVTGTSAAQTSTSANGGFGGGIAIPGGGPVRIENGRGPNGGTVKGNGD
jgi:macrolide-specific efflux system membrane fusion protein